MAKQEPASAERARIFENAQELIHGCLLFEGIDRSVLEHIASFLEVETFEQGEPIFLEGELSDRIFFVKSGVVSVMAHDYALRKTTPVRTVHSGDYFSELSVLLGSNHSTSCVAADTTVLLTLNKQNFFNLVGMFPQIARNLIKQIALTIRQTNTQGNRIEYLKENELEFNVEMKRILPLPMLERFEVLPIRLNFNVLTVASVKPFEKNFLDVFQQLNPNVKLETNLISRADFFRILRDVKANYEASGTVPRPSAPIPARPRLAVLKNEALSEMDEAVDYLRSAYLFSELTDEFLRTLAKTTQLKTYAQGAVIFSQDGTSDTFYVIRRGEVELSQRSQEGTSQVVSVISDRDSFGELSLLLNRTHALTARTRKPAEIFEIPKSQIEFLLEDSSFALRLAKVLSRRLQLLNYRSHWKLFTEEVKVVELIGGQVLPFSILRDYQILPIRLQNSTLILGAVRPQEEQIYQIINRYLYNYQVQIVLIQPTDFERCLDEIKIRLFANREKFPMKIASNGPRIHGDNAVEFVKDLIQQAIYHRASDIHIETQAGSVSVRYRIDGRLSELHEKLRPEFGKSINNCIKVMANLDISVHQQPQDGQIALELDGNQIQARVSTMPVAHGENVTLRVVHSQKGALPMKMLAPDREVVAFLQKAIAHQQGVFLVSGPTGSGKTTTLYSLLNSLNTVARNVVTIEDPIEMEIAGLNQTQVNRKTGLVFKDLLKVVLRQDPDVIMIGEIRDAESAQIAFNAALTGRLVLSTLHANDSLEILPRLRDLGVNRTTLAGAIIGSLAQRLVRVNCPACKTPRPATEFEKNVIQRVLAIQPPDVLFESFGCERCFGQGFLRRLPVFEYWQKNLKIRNALYEDLPFDQLANLVQENGLRSIDQSALKLVINGLTTVQEVYGHLLGIETTKFAR